ncbi:hypothetical protein [uncultured Algibacter sp.]|uniref:hypothetical protein n=1 Tax=uncultured Algibacter sp. TaxID=298659 RepID=UPI002635EAFB|nr:hypothetical protein [uncultured Algibacter sp.]
MNTKNRFDIENPNLGHEQRFLKKLKTQNKQASNNTRKSKRNLWNPLIGVAASIALLISIFIFSRTNNSEKNVAETLPDIVKTESLFASAFAKEISKLNSEEMPEYQELIVEAMFKIKVVEEDYNQLVISLKENPNDQLIISAMMLNFQDRIDVLHDVMEEIKEKEAAIKQSNNEVNTI